MKTLTLMFGLSLLSTSVMAAQNCKWDSGFGTHTKSCDDEGVQCNRDGSCSMENGQYSGKSCENGPGCRTSASIR